MARVADVKDQLQLPSTTAGAAATDAGLAVSEWQDRFVTGPLFKTRRMGRQRTLIRVAQILIVVALIGVWEWIGHGSKTQFLIISTPWTVAKWIWQWMNGNHAHGWDDLYATLEGAGLGWLLGIVIGVVLAAALAASQWLRLFAAPFVSVLNALPKIALAPLFILIFGESLQSVVYFVTAGIFFITFYNVFGGLRSIDPTYIRNARVQGAGRLWLIREVYGPSIVGWVMTSLRLTAAWAIGGAVISEWLGSQKGMGWIVAAGQETQQVPEVLGGILVVAFSALIIDRVIVRVERRFSRWRVT